MRASVVIVLVSLQLYACSDRRSEVVEDAGIDQGKVPDIAAPEPDTNKPQPDVMERDVFVMPDYDPTAPTFDFVFDRLLVPGGAGEYGVDLDGNGSIDNALGGLIATVAQFMGGGDIQGMVDEAVYSGEALLLMRLYADDIVTDPTVPGDLWYADPVACCASPSNLTACRTEADASCFSGTYAFTAVPPATALGGKITDDQIEIGAPKLALPLPMIGGALSVTLSHVKLKGTLTSDGIEDGIIAGALTQEEIDTKIMPAVAMALDQAYQGGTQELAMFDTNGNGAIEFDEVINNDLISGLFAGDVDIDGDGINELSFGMGFTAVNAMISAP